MLLEAVIKRFILEKKRNPIHVAELQNFIKKSYILGELSIIEYKQLTYELEQRYPELSA